MGEDRGRRKNPDSLVVNVPNQREYWIRIFVSTDGDAAVGYYLITCDSCVQINAEQ